MALVAIVGRPNVGKSTLFNRLTKSRRAIVSEEAGTTRDRQYGKCECNGKEFSVVDTGGWVVNSDDIFEEEIRKQVMVATEEADMVLFLVDAQNGLTDWDEDVAAILRRSKLPVILVVNKVDNNNQYYDAYEFYKLGLGDPQCISSASGSGTGDLLDLVLEKLQGVKDEDDIEREKENIIKLFLNLFNISASLSFRSNSMLMACFESIFVIWSELYTLAFVLSVVRLKNIWSKYELFFNNLKRFPIVNK